MTPNRGAHGPKMIFCRLYGLHTPCRQHCRRWIIHVFLILLTQAVSTTVFGLAVGFFTFWGLPISLLGLAMIFASAKQPTRITAICLAPKTAPAYAKH
jgi:hypothetical protein